MTTTSDFYTFDPRPRYPLVSTVKRYNCQGLYSDDDDNKDAVTLTLAHGTGFHKESWEPTLEELNDILRSQSSLSTGGVKIRDVWSIDCPNHGDAAVINEDVLGWGYTNAFGWEEYARSIHLFLTGQGTGVPVNFQTRKIIGIGHSMGAIALMLAGMYSPQITFESLILVDPMLIPRPLKGQPEPMGVPLEAGAAKRRDIWPSREEALKFFLLRTSFKVWDERVLKLLVEHGLRDLPTAEYPDEKQGVTLKCHKLQEAACYRDTVGRTRAYALLPHLCSILPIHFIYGGTDDYLPAWVKKEVLHSACRGKYASIARVAGAGHLVPQMQPQGLAEAIWVVLTQDLGRRQLARSKL